MQLLQHLKNRGLLWQAQQQARLTHTTQNVQSTGYTELDKTLVGGFPQQGVVELQSGTGIGELRLLLPTLFTRQAENHRLLAFIAPPYPLNAEMLAEYGLDLSKLLIITPQIHQQSLWSAEQCLKSGCCAAVLLWGNALNITQVKRLQLAAKTGNALQILFRQLNQSSLSLPVSLGIKLQAHQQGLKLTINKRKGGWPSQSFVLNMHEQWPELTLPRKAPNVIPFVRKKVG